jgi:hypothetical protein
MQSIHKKTTTGDVMGDDLTSLILIMPTQLRGSVMCIDCWFQRQQ